MVTVEENKFVCEECGHEIVLDDTKTYEVGDIIECEVCGTVYEVVNTAPLQVNMVVLEK